jgi:ABC-type transport system involved in cytochrome c biogenesis permease component
MMEEKQLAILERLIDVLGQGTSLVIDEYTVWHIASAIVWILMGLGALVASYKIWQYEVEDRDYEGLKIFMSAAVALYGVLLIGFHIPDLFAPRAIAIHQLLNDLIP